MVGRSIYDLYKGFYITKPVGNNAFSYARRSLKKIYVPPLIKGNLEQIRIGREVVFCEIENGKEVHKNGLEYFVHAEMNHKDIFVFDNHNHAFFFWLWGLKEGKIQRHSKLVHIDQHRDTRSPSQPIALNFEKSIDLQHIFDYTNVTLNVGNFIQPVLDLQIFSEVEMIMESEAFNQIIAKPLVLDLDLDIFAPEMEYIDFKQKLSFIKECIAKSDLITIATSPFFMNQVAAITIIKQLFPESPVSAG